MDDDFAIILEFFLFASNIKKEVSSILDSFLSFLRKYEEKKVHNMLSLMLDSWIKNLCLVFSFVGCKQGISIVEECESLYNLCFWNVIITYILWKIMMLNL